MMTALLLTILFNTYLITSSKKCRTNNDCEMGRCEWRRCVAKLQRGISRRMEVKACYVDEDCYEYDWESVRVLCKNGVCVLREPMIKEYDLGDWECFTESCPSGSRCGIYNKCYDMSSNKYAIESLRNIPCVNEKPDFCSKITGYPDVVCRKHVDLIENKKIFHICQFPAPFKPNRLKPCLFNTYYEYWECPRFQICLKNTCYFPFWVTARERCTNDGQCNFDTKCNMTSGQCIGPAPTTPTHTCISNYDCNKNDFERRVVKRICERFECRSRRRDSTECAACKFEEYCDLRERCHVVLRYTEMDCDRGNWFYFYYAYFCVVKVKRNRTEAFEDCKKLKVPGSRQAYLWTGERNPSDRNDVEAVLHRYFTLITGWINERDDGVEQKFVDWYYVDNFGQESYYVCGRNLYPHEKPVNASISKQRCQTSFVLRGNTCYLGGFTNFMVREKFHILCGLLDSEMVRIMNEEEARVVYGIAGGKSFWLGLRKDKRHWYWDGGNYGHRARYFFWRTGQPHMAFQSVCAYSRNDGEWETADCENFTAPRTYICQREPYNV